MSSIALTELAIDFIVVSTIVLSAALLLVSAHRPSLRSDVILKIALIASLLVPLSRTAVRLFAESAPAGPMALVPIHLRAVPLQPVAASFPSAVELALAVWLAVAAAGVVRLAARNLRFMRRAARRALLISADWTAARDRLGSSTPLSIVPDNFASPFSFPGEICIPAWMVGSLGEKERLSVLAHEIEHVRRGDSRWAFFADLVCAVFWMQPLVHVVRRRLRSLAEERADASAVASAGSGFPLAEVLLEVTKRMSHRHVRPDFALLRCRSSLVSRVETLLGEPLTRRLSPWMVIVQVSVATVTGAAAPALHLVESHPTPPPIARAAGTAAPVLVRRSEPTLSKPNLSEPNLSEPNLSERNLSGPMLSESRPSVLRARTSAVDALVDVMERDESPQVRSAAAASLGRRRSREALPALRAAAQRDPNEHVRASAANAVERVER